MESRLMKIFRLVILSAALVALVVFMILHIRAGIGSQTSKLYLGLYILLIGWAGIRIFNTAKDLLR